MDLYLELRSFILAIHPNSNELLYHTHALTSLYSVTEKIDDAFCMIPIYTNHLNLGFNKGTVLNDPKNLLQGTGKYIRHIPIKEQSGFNNQLVRDLIKNAIALSMEDAQTEHLNQGLTISKIKE